MRIARIVGVLIVALSALGCGTDPAAGQEGELCGADGDCAVGSICERSVCRFLVGQNAGPRAREGLFFVVIELESWTGQSQEGQLRQLGQFVSDLSTVLSPYYGGHATSETQLRFGRIDATREPLLLDESRATTAMLMRRSGSTYLADQDTLLVPVFYSDDSVSLAFNMPLTDATIRFDFDEGFQPGSVGAVSLSGSLRADDAELLSVEQGGQTFTLFDVLRSEALNADTNFDGIPDAWTMSWLGTATAL